MQFSEEWNRKEIEENEAETLHKPIEEEYSLYQAIRSGDIDYVRAYCEKGEFGDLKGLGILSTNSLTNIKYHFVVSAAMISRHCIEGGMELEQAFRLSDFYILKMDSYLSVDAIVSLHGNMCMDYTEKMLLIQKEGIISKSIQQCLQYIYSHVNGKVTLEELAEQVQLSPGYLSRLFTHELGVSVSSYIRNLKIEKAKNLLKYSDYSYIEIANYLAFSSQSHFIQTFREHTGITPKKYRDKYYHTTW